MIPNEDETADANDDNQAFFSSAEMAAKCKVGPFDLNCFKNELKKWIFQMK